MQQPWLLIQRYHLQGQTCEAVFQQKNAAASNAEEGNKAYEPVTAVGSQHAQLAEQAQQAQHAQQAQFAQRFNAGKHARKREREAQKKTKAQAKSKGNAPAAAEAKAPAVVVPSLQQQAITTLHPPQVRFALHAALDPGDPCWLLEVIEVCWHPVSLLLQSSSGVTTFMPMAGSAHLPCCRHEPWSCYAGLDV